MKVAMNAFAHALAADDKQVGLWIHLCSNFDAAGMGKLGSPMNPEIWSLIKPAAQKLIAKGVPAGTLVLAPDLAAELPDEGLLAKASDQLRATVKVGLA